MFTKGVITITTFGAKLKRCRLAAGLTQEQLAQKCGMKKQSISRYEKSEREPNIRIASALANAMGVTLESLVNSVDLQYYAQDNELTDKQKEFIRLVSQLTDQEVSFLLSQVKGLLQDR